MIKKSNSSQALLARAYALSSDEETRSLYQDWAGTYDETMLNGLSYLTPENTSKLLIQVVTDKQALILDVGSGTGLAGQNLSGLGYTNIHALDHSTAMLGVAKARQNNGKQVYTNIIQADLNLQLGLQDDTYDAIICTGLFTHAHVGAGCLPELFRILKPGGFFATTVHKDVWHEAGFEEQVKILTDTGVLKTHSKKPDIFFATDVEPQGFYILWERLL